jgi:hypothetical protein
MAMNAYGGDVEITLNGTTYVLTEMPKFDTDRYDKSEIVNADSSVDMSYRPAAGMVSVTFRDRGEAWPVIANGGPYVVSIVEAQTGVSHVINGARFSGRASIDRSTGEVSGLSLSFATASYIRRGG